MKIFHLMFVVAAIRNEIVSGAYAGTIAAYQSNGFTEEAVIHQLFELIRNIIKTGSTEHDIPIVDPYEFQHEEFSWNNDIFRADIFIEDAILTGLGDFRLQQFNFSKSEVALDFKMEWPLLKFHSDYYELHGDIWNAVPILGRGVMYFEIYDFMLFGKLYLKPSVDGKSITLKEIKDAHFSVGRIVSRTDIDNNIDEIYNEMVEELLPGYLNRFSGYLATSYSQNIIDYLNPILEKFDTWNIITNIL